MIEGLITIPKESLEYNFVVITGLESDNKKMKDAINEVLEVLNGDGVPNTEWIKRKLTEL